MGTVFHFKQFAVDQADCAMKINTDGVLLAAQVEEQHYRTILDIGSGTGVIALMLAQRFQQAQVDAVELDPAAADRAASNFANSAFQARMHLFKGSFQALTPADRYDLIISNPPFYTDSLKNPDQRKTLARHTDIQFFEEMIQFAFTQLSEEGTLQLILPEALAEQVVELAYGRLFLQRSLSIYSFEGQELVRKVIQLGRHTLPTIRTEDLVIYAERGVYTPAYKQLLKEYFLAF